MRIITTYDEIKHSRKVSGLCHVCGKKRTRVVSSSQTVNPFNRHADGIPKTAWAVQEAVLTILEEKVKELRGHFVCATCASTMLKTKVNSSSK